MSEDNKLKIWLVMDRGAIGEKGQRLEAGEAYKIGSEVSEKLARQLIASGRAHDVASKPKKTAPQDAPVDTPEGENS